MDYARNSYAKLKWELIEDKILIPTSEGDRFHFTRAYAFHSVSATGAVVLDRNINGRTRWYVCGSDFNYHEWQERSAENKSCSA